MKKAGPFEFDPVQKTQQVQEALRKVSPDVQRKAEEDAKQISLRLEKSMTTWVSFASLVRAELAALGVRVTAIEEEIAAFRARLAPPTRRGQ
jgi:polyhydroxyalkanoate synthesis regulator phasin